MAAPGRAPSNFAPQRLSVTSELQAIVNQGVDLYLEKKDFKAAVSCFQKAADFGDAHAQYCLGLCLANGKGIEQVERYLGNNFNRLTGACDRRMSRRH